MRKKRNAIGLVLLLATALLTGGCASSMMLPTEAFTAGPDYAVVNFLRPSSFGGAIKFGIWDREEFIGIVTPKSYVQYKASPGEHLFMARAENWSVIKATVEAGKTYYIIAEPKMGVWKARVAMTVQDPNDARVAKWMRALRPIAVDPVKRDAYMADHLPGVKEAAQSVEAGKIEYSTMKPADGK